jgi:hypothetical protein
METRSIGKNPPPRRFTISKFKRRAEKRATRARIFDNRHDG